MCIVLYCELLIGAWVWHMLMRDYTVLPATHTLNHNRMSHPAFCPQLQSITTLWLVLCHILPIVRGWFDFSGLAHNYVFCLLEDDDQTHAGSDMARCKVPLLMNTMLLLLLYLISSSVDATMLLQLSLANKETEIDWMSRTWWRSAFNVNGLMC